MANEAKANVRTTVKLYKQHGMLPKQRIRTLKYAA